MHIRPLDFARLMQLAQVLRGAGDPRLGRIEARRGSLRQRSCGRSERVVSLGGVRPSLLA